jgi:hypothetical protein
MFRWIKDMWRKQKEADIYLDELIKIRKQEVKEQALSLIKSRIKFVEDHQNEISEDQINTYLKDNLEIAKNHRITRGELETIKEESQ